MVKRNVQVRVDENLKVSADKIFEELGFTTTQAIKIFLKASLRHRGLPFELKLENEETSLTLKEVRAMENGTMEKSRYSSASDLVDDLI